MKLKKKFLVIVVALAFVSLICLSGCEEKSDTEKNMDKMGKQAEEGAKDAEKEGGKLAEELEKKSKDAAKELEKVKVPKIGD